MENEKTDKSDVSNLNTLQIVNETPVDDESLPKIISGDPAVMNTPLNSTHETDISRSDSLEPDPVNQESSTCTVCGYLAVYAKKRNEKSALCCYECNRLVHFPCSKLPAYMLYKLTTSAKRYVCEACVNTPTLFLQNLIRGDINNTDDNTCKERSLNITEDEGRYERLECKVNNLCTILEKYDIPRVADNVQAVYENLTKLNNNFHENVALLGKAGSSLEKISSSNEKNAEDCELKQRLDKCSSEIDALKSAETLLHDSINEKSKIISSLMNDKEKHIKIINEVNTGKQSLLLERGSLENTINDQREEIGRLNAVLSDLKTKSSQREIQLDCQCQSQQTQIEGKQDIINFLTQTNTKLQENLTEVLKRQEEASPVVTTPITGTQNVNVSDTSLRQDSHDRPTVVLFHDSLCNKINNTMMSKEKVSITKVWAPTLGETQEKVDDVDRVDRIVIQGLTREVGDMDTGEYTALTVSTVDKCLTKAEKVIVSLIVDREDDVEIRAKAEAVNAMLKLKYMNNSDVLLCNHDNLRDRRYRQMRDNLHLTDPGTSRLANNFKYKIAESLDIQVVKKRRSEYTDYRERVNYEQREVTNQRSARNGEYTDRPYNHFQNGSFWQI